MSNEHVDYMLYELARAAILKRVAEVCRDLRKAEEQSEVARGLN